MKEVMNLQEKKLELVQLILHTEKPAILRKVEAVLRKEKDVDWWDEISDDERDAIEQGIKEAEAGELKSHAEVLKERRERYNLDQ
jgi:predicted transcriptional regulator